MDLHRCGHHVQRQACDELWARAREGGGAGRAEMWWAWDMMHHRCIMSATISHNRGQQYVCVLGRCAHKIDVLRCRAMMINLIHWRGCRLSQSLYKPHRAGRQTAHRQSSTRCGQHATCKPALLSKHAHSLLASTPHTPTPRRARRTMLPPLNPKSGQACLLAHAEQTHTVQNSALCPLAASRQTA